jgi:hypothetical protein
MSLEDVLRNNRDAILEKWFNAILATYSEDARNFMKAKSNRFANPVGSSISDGLAALFQRLVDGSELECPEVCAFLDGIIRIRAVQEYSPADALGFVFDLKAIARETVERHSRDSRNLEELLTFERRIDKLSLLAFNIYMQCREKVYELKVHEFKRSYSRVVQRACQTWEARGEPVPDELKVD